MNKKELMETTLSQKEIFEGRIFSVHVDAVALPDGRESTREVVHHISGGACVVPLIYFVCAIGVKASRS